MGDEAGRGRRPRAALPVLVAMGAALLAGAVVVSPIFDVKEVVVRGTRVLSPERVVELSGVEEGESLLFVSEDELSRGLRTSPWVADVEVQRSLPSTLVLVVRERVPVAWAATPGGEVPVAADGTVLGPSDLVSGYLPSVDAAPRDLAPGDALPGDGAALRVAGSLSQSLRRRVASIGVMGGEVVLRLRPGGRVLYGTASAMGRKNEALSAALGWAESRGLAVAYVDVRVPERPAVRPVGEPTAVTPSG